MSTRPYGLKILVTSMELISSIGLLTIAIKAFYCHDCKDNILISAICFVVSLELIYFVYLNWIYFFNKEHPLKIVSKFFKKEYLNE